MVLLWILIIFGWNFAMMVPFFYVLKLCSLLRISPEEEVRFALACMTAKTLLAMLCQDVHLDMHRQCMPRHKFHHHVFRIKGGAYQGKRYPCRVSVREDAVRMLNGKFWCCVDGSRHQQARRQRLPR